MSNLLQMDEKTFSLYRLAQICAACLSLLYLLRGVLSAQIHGVSFPALLTSIVGLFLIPIFILLKQPPRWLPNLMIGTSIIGLVANPTMMYIYRAQETFVIFSISVIIIFLWVILFGIFCLPLSRQISKIN